MNHFIFSFTLLAAMLVFESEAQVPQLINYQGRIAVGGTNFNGTGGFKFALVNSNATVTFWSNDGSSVAGSEPGSQVPLGVSNGLYSVQLGDTSLLHMTVPVPSPVFTNNDVRLRVWFSDFSHGSQLLAPDQRFAAVGYALMADNIKDGAITSAKLATGAVTSGKIANGAIGTAQLAAGAVTAANIASGAVSSVQLAKPPQSGNIAATNFEFDFYAATFTANFNPPFSTTPIVTLSLESTNERVITNSTFTIEARSQTSFTGRWRSSSLLQPAPKTIASSGVAYYISLAVVNGKPAVAYWDSGSNDLKYVRAADANGSSWNAPITLDSAGDVGYTPSLAIVNGNPAIAYRDLTGGNLKYIRALDPDGTSWNAPVLADTNGNSGMYASLAVVNGRPAVAYQSGATGWMKFVRAGDIDGATWGLPVFAVTNDASYNSLAVANGNPAIAFYSYDGTNSSLKFVRATTVNGGSWGQPVLVDTNYPATLNLVVVNGNPAIAYRTYLFGPSSQVRYIRAADSSGSSWNTPVPINNPGDEGTPSLSVINGRPAIAITHTVPPNSFVVGYTRALDVDGAVWNPPANIFSGSGGGVECSALAFINGQPGVVFYLYGGSQLKFLSPSSVTDFSVNWIALEP